MKSQKKKNKKTKKLRSLVLILFLTIIMFGTSTYAWFTANRVVRIESIDVHVETSDGLQISTNGTTWKSVITTDDIKTGAYSGANNFIPDSLDAVSTNGEAISDSEAGTRLLNMYSSSVNSELGINDGNYTIYTQKVNESNDKTKFIAFDIFLKVSNDKIVYLNSESGTSSSVVKRTGVTYDDRGLKNAARIAFVPIGEASASASTTEITKAFYASNPSPIKIWEPNNDVHSQTVVNTVGPEYGFKNATALTTTSCDPVTYYGIKSALPESEHADLVKVVNGTKTTYVSDGSTITFSQAVSQGNVNTENNKYITDGVLISTPTTLASGVDYQAFALRAGITKMRVYMWIEGQDIDCENNASGTDITYNLELSIRGN